MTGSPYDCHLTDLAWNIALDVKGCFVFQNFTAFHVPSQDIPS